MRYLVTGVTGQLGHDVVMELNRRGGCEILGVGRSAEYSGICDDYVNKGIPYSQLDLTCENDVLRIFEQFRPDQVIHCASWTKVDAAEWPENRDEVLRANVIATYRLAEACRQYDACMTYISTDYVFGEKAGYSHRAAAEHSSETHVPDRDRSVDVLTEASLGSDRIAAMQICEAFKSQSICDELYRYASLLCSDNLYGQTKLLGEKITETIPKYYIVRVSWSFGENGGNFVKTMLKLGKTRQITPEMELSGDSPSPLTVVDDQIGRPTYTADAACRILDIIGHKLPYGIYHAVGSGEFVSWFGFAKEIFRTAGMRVPVVAVSAGEYESSVRMADDKPRADRPLNSRLVCEKAETAGLTPMPDWKDALRRYLEKMI